MNENFHLEPEGGIAPIRWRIRIGWKIALGLALVILLTASTLVIVHPWQKTLGPGSRTFRTVVIDAGHGGFDSGALGNGVREKDLCLDVALRLDALLRHEGFRTVLTRKDDTFIPLPERAQIANREKDSIFVSIHFNQTDNRIASGIETWESVSKSGNPGDELMSLLHLAKNNSSTRRFEDSLAQSIQGEVVSAMGAVDRGVKQRNLYVVRNVQSPAVLVEGGFVSNPRTVQSLESKAYRAKLAESIMKGILKYRGGWEPAPTLMAKLDR